MARPEAELSINYNHYSDKGGHFFRGLRRKAETDFCSHFPGIFSRGLFPCPVISFNQRRLMRRISDDGRSR